METNLSAFNLDMLSGNSAWSELFAVLSAANDADILAYAEQLAQIRKIDATSDQEALLASVRQLGFNLPRDLMTMNSDRFRDIFYSLPDYHRVSGTTDWPKFVSFLLGYRFKSRRLYSADYVTFFPTPLGPLVSEGGKWYKTTHAEIEIDAQLIESGIDLRLIAADRDTVVTQLVNFESFTQTSATDWFNSHVGYEPNNVDPIQRVVRMMTFWRRVEDLFYQWAPIEEVLYGMWVSLEVVTTFRIGSVLCLEPMHYVSIGKPYVVSEEFVYPTSVTGGQTVEVGYHITYSDGYEETRSAKLVCQFFDETDSGYVVSDVEFIQDTQAELIYEDKRLNIHVTIYPMGVQAEPGALVIDGPTNMYGGTNYRLTATGFYGDRYNEISETGGQLTWSSTLGTFDGNTLILPSVDEDTAVEVSCKYVGGMTLHASKVFIVQQSYMSKVPVSMSLIGPTTIEQGIEISLLCLVTYNDNTVVEVVPVMKSSSNNVHISNLVVSGEKDYNAYVASVSAQYQEAGRVISASLTINFVPKAVKIGKMRIDMPTVYERDWVRPTLRILWVDDLATAAQIEAEDPSIVYGWMNAQAQWNSVASSGFNKLPSISSSSGEFQAPIVDADTDYMISATFIRDGKAITYSSGFPVKNRAQAIAYLDLVMSPSIASGSRIGLRTDAVWNTGKRTSAAVTYTVTYEPSESAVDEAKLRTAELIAELTASGQSVAGLDVDAPDYTRWVDLELVTLPSQRTDPILGMLFNTTGLYFSGDLHGLAIIEAKYTYNGVTSIQSLPVSLVPTRALVTDLSIEAQDYCQENTRTFVRALASYSDGTSAYVPAKWSATYDGSDTSDYPLLTFISGTYSGLEIVDIVSGVKPATFQEFLALPVSRWSMFSNIGSISELESTSYEGAVLAVRRLDVAQLVVDIQARYYRVGTKRDIVLIEEQPGVIDSVVLAKVIGPLEFSASLEYVGYALVNTYEIPASLSSTGEAIRYDMEVSSDWAIAKTEYMVNGVWLETADEVVTVSDDGYVTPIQNVTARITIRTTFDDGATSFTRDIVVIMVEANVYLASIFVYGPTSVQDDVTKNPTANYSHGTWYVPYTVRVILADTSEIIPDYIEWSLASPSYSEGIVLDQSTGRLYVDHQKSDTKIEIFAKYSAQAPDGHYESISGSMVVNILSATAIESAYIELPQGNLDANKDHQLVAYYKRRTGYVGSSSSPDSTVSFEWSLDEHSTSATLTQDGVLRFDSSALAQEVLIRVKVTEGITVIEEALRAVCPGVGFPLALQISGYTNVRDDSSINFIVSCTRQQRPTTDETTNCLYMLVDGKGNETYVRDVQLDNGTGVLTVGHLVSDIQVRIKALFIEGNFRMEAYHTVNLFSSYPRFGVAAFGVNTMAEVEANLKDRHNSTVGGTLTLDANGAEFGYFCSRADFGAPVFAALTDSKGVVNSSWLGWDGAKWPVSGNGTQLGPIKFDKVYDNITDSMLLYRTNARAFGFALLSVRYTS